MEAELAMWEPEEPEAQELEELQAVEPEAGEREFGILMAPVDARGTWAALKELRAALRALRPEGAANLLFIDALGKDGKACNLQDPNVTALVIGYSLKPA